MLIRRKSEKVLLCMAFAKRAPLLLLDEPEAMLDQKALEGLLRIIEKQTSTMLIVTHSQIYEEFVDSVMTLQEQHLSKKQISCRYS